MSARTPAQLGCNYSPQLVALLERKAVSVEWIKLSRWDAFAEELAVARALRPVLLHVLPRAGLSSFDMLPWTWDEMNAATAACGSPHAALHLASRAADWRQPPTRRDLLDRLAEATRTFASNLSAPLLIENVDYTPYDTLLREPTDPELIAEVCGRADVGLLLDLAHARIAAYHRREEVHGYVSRLPLERVREVHVCGPAVDAERGIHDAHAEMGEEDYALLAWTLARTSPLVVSLEYSGTGPLFAWRSDAPAIERQLTRLRGML